MVVFLHVVYPLGATDKFWYLFGEIFAMNFAKILIYLVLIKVQMECCIRFNVRFQKLEDFIFFVSQSDVGIYDSFPSLSFTDGSLGRWKTVVTNTAEACYWLPLLRWEFLWRLLRGCCEWCLLNLISRLTCSLLRGCQISLEDSLAISTISLATESLSWNYIGLLSILDMASATVLSFLPSCTRPRNQTLPSELARLEFGSFKEACCLEIKIWSIFLNEQCLE